MLSNIDVNLESIRVVIVFIWSTPDVQKLFVVERQNFCLLHVCASFSQNINATYHYICVCVIYCSHHRNWIAHCFNATNSDASLKIFKIQHARIHPNANWFKNWVFGFSPIIPRSSFSVTIFLSNTETSLTFWHSITHGMSSREWD